MSSGRQKVELQNKLQNPLFSHREKQANVDINTFFELM
jgi:hypothetical protein